jgi:hypothetical protein
MSSAARNSSSVEGMPMTLQVLKGDRGGDGNAPQEKQEGERQERQKSDGLGSIHLTQQQQQH